MIVVIENYQRKKARLVYWNLQKFAMHFCWFFEVKFEEKKNLRTLSECFCRIRTHDSVLINQPTNHSSSNNLLAKLHQKRTTLSVQKTCTKIVSKFPYRIDRVFCNFQLNFNLKTATTRMNSSETIINIAVNSMQFGSRWNWISISYRKQYEIPSNGVIRTTFQLWTSILRRRFGL
jgi:hypothetical protein